MTTTQLATVEFHGQALTVITGPNGEHLVAMKPICENIGLEWHAQRQRIKRHPVLSEGAVIITAPSKSGDQEYTCLPLDYLNGWLFGVDSTRVKPEIRPRLIQYQRECFQVLAAYWQQGEAINPRSKPKKPKALPNGLTTEQQEAIKGLVKARVDSLPQDKRAKAAVKCWSALKNTFGCTYKKIDPNQFTDAVSLVARLELEGEFLGKDDQAKLEPFAQIIGRPLKPIERWIVYTDGCDKEQYRPIPIDSFVMTPAKLLYVMANTPDAPIPTQDLFDFVVAALSKLKAIRSAKTVPQEEFNEGAKMVSI